MGVGAGQEERHAHEFRSLCRACASHAAGTSWSADADLIDPEQLWRLVRRHRVTAPFLDKLAVAMQSDPDLERRLAARSARCRMDALRHARQLATVSAALTTSGIAHLAIKGPALAKRLYDDVASRESKDLDLLVDPRAIDDAAAVLSLLGFDAVDDPRSLGGSIRKDRTFAGSGIEIELHSRLLDVEELLPMPFDRLWQGRTKIMVGSSSVPTMSDVDTLLYLCAHGASHLWFRLKWLEDIARFVAISDAGLLGEAMRRARQAGSEAILVAALDLVEDLFETVVPARARSRGTWASRALVRLSRKAIRAPAELGSSPSIAWILRKILVQFAMGRRWRYRSQLLRVLALSPHHFDVSGLPEGFGWMRLPLRPVMLLRHRWRQSARRS